MGKIFKYILALIFFFTCALNAQAASIVKITGLEFDNSDNIVAIKSIGKIYPALQTQTEAINSQPEQNNIITKGYLSDPERIFVDITNAVLAGGAQTKIMKNSALESIKLSQFSTNPNVVRIVFTYNKKASPENFKIFANDRQISMLYSTEFVEAQKFVTVYNNMEPKEKGKDIYEAATYCDETKELDEITNVPEGLIMPDDPTQQTLGTTISATYKTKISDPKETKLKSLFYLDSVLTQGSGALLGGQGLVSIKSSFTLDNPTRVVYDIENAILAQNLRNRNFAIPNDEPLVKNSAVSQREVLRLGQNTKNVVRIVIQGENAKDYRVVFSPDLQGIFIAKRKIVLNSKLTQTASTILGANSQNLGENLDVINLNFSTPVSFTMFEENSKFYLDLQNVASYNSQEIAKIPTLSTFKDFKIQKIATEKTRLIVPMLNSYAINAQISPDAKQMRIYFKKRTNTSVEQKTPVIKPSEIKEDKKIRPSVLKQMYKVVIDAGHGGADVGATRDGVYEKDITLAVAKEVQKLLDKRGVFTYMVRDNDKYLELSERSDFANQISPDAFVSIHVNSSVKDEIIGLETHWYKENSLLLAKKIHEDFASEKNLDRWETKNRGLFQSQFYVINHTEAPAVLIEIGFLSNPHERKLLIKEKRQEEIAKSIADGIWGYLKSKK